MNSKKAPENIAETAEKSSGKTKEQRIRAEKSRLRKLYRELPDLKKKLAEPVIERASFMRVEMEDLEEDLRENGWTELFSQSDKTEPYERARPAGQSYQSLIGNYQKIIKLLDSFLPPPETKQKNTVDPFDEFIAERDR